MGNILIANIGNRNLKYEGEHIADYLKKLNPQPTFRDFTKFLLDNYDSEKNKLTVLIIDKVFIEYQNNFDKVVLIGTNQELEGGQNYIEQDTIFSSEIIAKKLIEEGFTVKIEVIKDNVANAEALYKPYQQLLNKLADENPESKFVICDAGGTPQQKVALKIMAEYLWDDDKFEVVYVSERDGIQKQGTRNLRGIIAKLQAEELIKANQYYATNLLLRKIIDKKKRQIIELAAICYDMVFGGRFKEITDEIFKSDKFSAKSKNLALKLNEPEFELSYLFNKPIDKRYVYMLASKAAYFAQNDLINKSPIEFLINIHKLYEYIIDALIERYISINDQGKKIKLISNNNQGREMREAIPILKSNRSFMNMVANYPAFELGSGLPSKVLIIFYFINEVPEKYNKFIQTTKLLFLNPPKPNISDLRNNFAHNGAGFTLEDIQKASSDLVSVYASELVQLCLGEDVNFIKQLQKTCIDSLD